MNEKNAKVKIMKKCNKQEIWLGWKLKDNLSQVDFDKKDGKKEWKKNKKLYWLLLMVLLTVVAATSYGW